METIRFKIKSALNVLIEEKNGIKFQRIAIHCLRSKWPSLIAAAEYSDAGEDALTVTSEGTDKTIRSLSCSLTAKKYKLINDAKRIRSHRSNVQEYIFATPKIVNRLTQIKWESEIFEKFGWKLIVIEQTEILNILERPESQFICKQFLGLNFQLSELINDICDRTKRWVEYNYLARGGTLIKYDDFLKINKYRSNLIVELGNNENAFLLRCAIQNGMGGEWGKWVPYNTNNEKIILPLIASLDYSSGWKPAWRSAFVLERLYNINIYRIIEKNAIKLSDDIATKFFIETIFDNNVVKLLFLETENGQHKKDAILVKQEIDCFFNNEQ
ncbi:MAG: hypothetical protein H7833_04965 [Magnetococcus sp. DMHC-1]|nr:hypothetical protein [Magnetococcales bacterium]